MGRKIWSRKLPLREVFFHGRGNIWVDCSSAGFPDISWMFLLLTTRSGGPEKGKAPLESKGSKENQDNLCCLLMWMEIRTGQPSLRLSSGSGASSCWYFRIGGASGNSWNNPFCARKFWAVHEPFSNEDCSQP